MGVRLWVLAGGEHRFVAGRLSGPYECGPPSPGQRIGPVQRAPELPNEAQEEVPALQVGHLVEKHEPSSLGRPLLGGFRKENRRRERTERHRRRVLMEPNLDGTFCAQLLPNPSQKLAPVRVFCLAGRSAEAPRPHKTGKQAGEKQCRPCPPESNEDCPPASPR